MRRPFRLAIVLAAIVIFSGPGSRALAQAPPNDAGLKRAAALESAGKSQEAITAYDAVFSANRVSNPELAARALYLAGLYAQSDRFGSTSEEKDQGLKKALQEWKQLHDSYAGLDKGTSTQAGRSIVEPQTDAPAGRYLALLGRAGTLEDISAECNRIVRASQRENPNLAAEALYQAGLLSQAWGKTPAEKQRGQDQAHTMWTQIRNEFATTPAGRSVLDPAPGFPQGRLAALEADLDRRNSKNWNYQIVDTLVRLTGRNPHFSYALALILIAVIVKLITWPLTIKQYGSMREMQKIQPLVKELQKRFKGAELNQKTMELYKEHKVNPFAGCLPSLLQLPFLIWIYNTIREYQFAFAHGKFLWIGSPLAKEYPHIVASNLALPDMPLLVIYTVSNYVAMKMTPASDPQQQQQQNTMAIMSSAIFFWMFINWKFPSAFLLYWLALNLLNIWQQYEYIYKPNKAAKLNGGTAGGAATLSAQGPDKNGAGRAETERKSLSPASPPARVRPRKKKK